VKYAIKSTDASFLPTLQMTEIINLFGGELIGEDSMTLLVILRKRTHQSALMALNMTKNLVST
jgi:hypothetical protein